MRLSNLVLISSIMYHSQHLLRLGPLPLLNKTTCRLDPLDETLWDPPKKGHFGPPGLDPPGPPQKGGFAVLYQPLKSISR